MIFFRSNLTNRKQYKWKRLFIIALRYKHWSTPRQCTTVQSPILFLIYINGLSDCSNFKNNAVCRSGPQLRRGGANKNFALLKLLSMPPKLPLPLRHFQNGDFFIGDQQRTQRKLDQVGAMTFRFLFFFWRSSNPKILVPPPERNFAPLRITF